MKFNRLIKGITNTKLKINNLKSEFNSYINHQNDSVNDSIKKKTHPSFIKTNPFYWSYTIKSSIKDKYEKFIQSIYSGKSKLISNDSSKTSLEKTKTGAQNIINIVKTTAIQIVQKINFIIVKITGGKIDLAKISKELFNYQNYSLIINKSVNNIVIYTTKISKNLVIFQKRFLNYLEKYKDKSISNEFNRNNKDLNTKIERFYNIKKAFLGSFMLKTISSIKFIMQANQINKVNKFLNLPKTLQKVYYVRNYFSEYVSRLKRLDKDSFKSGVKTSIDKYSYENIKEKTKNIYEDRKKYSPSYIKNLIKNSTKRFFLKIFVYLVILGFSYNFIKYTMNKIFNKRADNDLKEALLLMKDLKKHNEELMKFNSQILQKLDKIN